MGKINTNVETRDRYHVRLTSPLTSHESHRPLGEPVPPSQGESPLPLTFTYHGCPDFRQTDYFPLGPFPSVLLSPRTAPALSAECGSTITYPPLWLMKTS